MILHNDKEIFNELIETTAGVLGIPAVFIEKDYWVTYILNKLPKSIYKSHLQIAINNPQFKLNQIQKKPFEIV